jgi:hypothetical protein
MATSGLAVAVIGLMVIGLVATALIGPAVPSVAPIGRALIAVNGLGTWPPRSTPAAMPLRW